MKYIKKPTPVEAFQWTADAEQIDDPVWAVEALNNEIISFDEIDAWGAKELVMFIQTPNGTRIAYRGDYIIRDAAGRIYPYEPDAFKKNYERVSE